MLHLLTHSANTLELIEIQASGYDPKKSRVSDDTLADFFRSQLTGDLQEIPGIGPAAAKCLAEGDDDDKITNR